MLTVELALRLREAGLAWEPQNGDRFAVPGRNLDGEVFVVSQMTIDAVDVGSDRLVRFNGTTEWALDSIEQDAVVWLPHESQLRARLGPAFRSLTGTEVGYAVEVVEPYDRLARHVAGDAECAYALALLAVIT